MSKFHPRQQKKSNAQKSGLFGLTLDHQEHGKGDLCCVHARELGKDVLRINDKTSVLRDPSRQLNSTLWWTSKPQRPSAFTVPPSLLARADEPTR